MIKSELNVECGKRLKKCLADFPMTQNELSKLTGYTQQYISNIIVGKKPMTVKAASLFSKYLNIRHEFLLCEDNDRTTEDVKKSENEVCDESYSLLTKCLDLIGVDILYNCVYLESCDNDMNGCTLKGSLLDPTSWIATTCDGTEIRVCLKSVYIVYENQKSHEISVGKFISILEYLLEHMTFIIEQLMLTDEYTKDELRIDSKIENFLEANNITTIENDAPSIRLKESPLS